MYQNIEPDLLLTDDPGGTELIVEPPVLPRPKEQRAKAPATAARSLRSRIDESETRLCKAVLPNTTNHYNTLFGGTAMALMDEVAFICATRFTRKRMVTASSDRIDFKRPIPAGTLIELVARVSYVGHTSLKVRVDIHLEDMYTFSREHAIRGEFTFVAIDEAKRPVSVLT